MMMMKKFRLLAFGLSALILGSGCSSEDDGPSLPDLSGTKVKYIAENSITVTSSILAENDDDVTTRGACWGTASQPTIEDDYVRSDSYDLDFTTVIEDLEAGTTYYVRAYVKNGDAATYGEEVMVTTTSPLDDIDGNSYPVVVIGDQTWTAENLKTTKYNDGTDIPNVTGEDAWSELETPAYCWWENDINEKRRGAFYNWYTVDTKKLCPTGWHVPTEEDWDALIAFFNGEVEDKLKEQPTNMYGDANETGFSAYPWGYRASGSGTFGRAGEQGWFWMHDGSDASEGYTAAMEVYESSMGLPKDDFNNMKMGFSVRCIKD